MAESHQVTGYDLVQRSSKKIQIATELELAVKDQDLIFIAVQTPHDQAYDGSAPLAGLPLKDFDYTHVQDALRAMAPYLRSDQVVVLISTVLPGTVRRELAPLLPELPGLELIYNPYLIAMGTEQWDFLHPEMIILGADSPDSPGLQKLKAFYTPLMKNAPQIHEGTWEEAEGIKIFYNTFISTKLSLVNMIQDVAERLGHMNVDVVTEALANSTQRIMSRAYMKAGMGDGGPCHPRDNIALRWFAQKYELGYDLFSAVIDSREGQARNLARRLLELGPDVVILGKAFKPGVSYFDGSYSLLVGHFIEQLGGRVHYYDPNTGDLAPSPFDPLKQVFLIGYWESWVREFPFPPNAIVLDPWRETELLPKNVRHVPYGNSRIS